VATQNPIEFEGTYPLPEAQRDRFLARIEMGLPDREAELEMFRRAAAGTLAGWSPASTLPGAVVSAEIASALRCASSRVHVEPPLLDYLARLADAVRRSPQVELAVSPRGCLALLEMARGFALVSARDYTTPDDFKRSLHACWAHRILLTAESEIEGHSAQRVLESVAASTDVPR
jgi:MoxR-like ATPase